MRWVRIATIFVVEIACFLCDAVYNLNTIPLGKFLLSSFERLYADDGGMCILNKIHRHLTFVFYLIMRQRVSRV